MLVVNECALKAYGLTPLARIVDHLANADWPAAAADLARIFAGRPRDAWVALLDGTDACLAPVLTLAQAPAHPHPAARATFADGDGTP